MNAMAPMMGELLGGLGGGAGADGCWDELWCPNQAVWSVVVLCLAVVGAGQAGIGALYNALPTLCCPSPAGARGRSARQLPANLPLEEALAQAGLSAEDAARWKATLEADEAVQAAAAPQAPLSDAYLAALPPRAAAGLLLRDDGDEEEWTEGEEEEEGEAAAAQ